MKYKNYIRYIYDEQERIKCKLTSDKYSFYSTIKTDIYDYWDNGNIKTIYKNHEIEKYNPDGLLIESIRRNITPSSDLYTLIPFKTIYEYNGKEIISIIEQYHDNTIKKESHTYTNYDKTNYIFEENIEIDEAKFHQCKIKEMITKCENKESGNSLIKSHYKCFSYEFHNKGLTYTKEIVLDKLKDNICDYIIKHNNNIIFRKEKYYKNRYEYYKYTFNFFKNNMLELSIDIPSTDMLDKYKKYLPTEKNMIDTEYIKETISNKDIIFEKLYKSDARIKCSKMINISKETRELNILEFIPACLSKEICISMEEDQYTDKEKIILKDKVYNDNNYCVLTYTNRGWKYTSECIFDNNNRLLYAFNIFGDCTYKCNYNKYNKINEKIKNKYKYISKVYRYNENDKIMSITIKKIYNRKKKKLRKIAYTILEFPVFDNQIIDDSIITDINM